MEEEEQTVFCCGCGRLAFWWREALEPALRTHPHSRLRWDPCGLCQAGLDSVPCCLFEEPLSAAMGLGDSAVAETNAWWRVASCEIIASSWCPQHFGS